MPPVPRPRSGKQKANAKATATSGRGSNRRLLLAMVAAAGVVVVAGFGLALLGGDSNAESDAPKLLQAVGCTVKTVDALAGVHSITTPEGTSSEWNTSPPTSGPHYELPAKWGGYTDPLNPAQFVHNLEHGGIFIQYGEDVSAATIADLTAFYEEHQNGTLLAPLAGLGSKIALGAWTTDPGSEPVNGTARLATCTAFDEPAFAAFFSAYQFKGPERFPASGLLPGT
jgi:Protein of unknown function (DUF3105)